MNRILVTGGAGFIGSTCVNIFSAPEGESLWWTTWTISTTLNSSAPTWRP